MAKWTKQDILQLTVEEAIEQLNIKVKLGACNGSAFVYCGNLSDIDIETLDTNIVNAYRSTYEKAIVSISNLVQKPKGYNDFVNETVRKKQLEVKRILKEQKGKPLTKEQEYDIKQKWQTSQTAYIKWVNAIKRRIESLKTTKRTTKYRLDTYTSIATRKIVDFYKSIDEEDTWIMIYDGAERGIAWTTEEYESGYIDFGDDTEE